MKLHQVKQKHSVTIIITSELKQQRIWLHTYPEVQLKATNKRPFKLKIKKNFQQTLDLNQYYHYLKYEYMQLKSHYSPLSKHKPLLLFHIVPFHISSQIKCYSSQFLETPRAAEKHTQSAHARWPFPGSGTAPPAEHLTVMTETDSNTHRWTGCTQQGTCPAAQTTPPWSLIENIRTG